MKLFIYIFIINLNLFSLKLIAQNRNGEIIYLAKYTYEHQKNSRLKNSKVVDYMNLEITKTKTIYYSSQRQIGYNKYLQELIDKPPLESLQNNEYYEDAESQILEYDFETKNFKIFDQLSFKSIYKCTDSVAKLNWKILVDTMTLVGQFCQKATADFRGRTYFAWFTSIIPISVGPYKFVGLPGLILKVNDDENQFNFECVELDQKILKKPVFAFYEKPKLISYKKLVEKQKLKIENRSLFMEIDYPNLTISRNDGKSLKINTQTVLAPYNPIEKTQ